MACDSKQFLKEVNESVKNITIKRKWLFGFGEKYEKEIYKYLDSEFDGYEIYHRKCEPSKTQAEILLRLKVLNKYGAGNNVIIYDFDLNGIPGRLYYKVEKEHT